MTEQRFIIEMGMGLSRKSGDVTKAACRAVENALSHSTLSLFDPLNLSPDAMTVKVTIGAQDPQAVDIKAIAALIPHGAVSVNVVSGGLNTTNPDTGITTVIASAAVEAFLPPQNQS